MNLAVGNAYDTKAMQEFFGVSESSWKKQKNKLLGNFSYYYEYEVERRGRKDYYHILKQLGDYQPIPKKGDRVDETYQSGIIQIIQEDNIQTAANVARRLREEDAAVKAFNHASGTTYEYTRVKMRNMFGTKVREGGTKGMISEKIWCRLDSDNNCYVPMTEEAIQNFFEIYGKSQEVRKEFELEIFCDYQNGLLTKEAMYEAIGERNFQAYLGARDSFKEKYGYYPIKVPVYELSAWETE